MARLGATAITRSLGVLALAGGLTLAAIAPRAEEPAALLAERVILTGSNMLIAEGSVEVLYRGTRMTARRVTYDSTTEQLSIEGPIRLTEPGARGNVLVADQAELSRDLQNGLLAGARMVLARELQLAADTIERREGRYTVLKRVVASSCEICAENPTPLWEIRARKVTHDAETRQISFESAQLRAMGVPVFYLPYLRAPDPTVERMSGFLSPQFRTTSLLGFGIKTPYFLTLGPSADLTFTPYVAASQTKTLGLRYRRAYDWGDLLLEGALSDDTILPGETRGYLFGDLTAQLPRDFRLSAQLRLVSDPSYLLNYDISDEDRLWSGIEIERVKRDQLIWARIGNTHSIREGESNSTQPMASATAQWIDVFRPAGIGGELTLDWQLATARRASGSVLDGDGDGGADGRDSGRLSMVADWRRNWLLPGGILATAEAELALDAISVGTDPAYDSTITRALPSAAVELRWPWVSTSGRAAHVIEPILQLVWSGDDPKAAPNEDSLLTEFDEGNLFSLSRFPGGDAREAGTRANLGLSYTRHDQSGWSLGLTAGRVFRLDDLGQFSSGSGLSGTRSDWLLGANLATASGLTVANRALFDDDLSISRNEFTLGYDGEAYDIATRYLWMEANAAEGRLEDLSELMLDTEWLFAPGWSGKLSARYDLTEDRASRTALGLQYANECVTVDLSLSRRFTSSSSVEPETGIGISVALAGFGAGGDARNATRRVCAR